MSAPPDEVLAAMAKGAYAVGRRWNAAAGKPAKPWEELDEEQQRYMLECSAAALAAADALGWQLVPKAEHKRLAERIAGLEEPYVDDRGEHWMAPTAYAYAAVCKALRTCKAERDAARAAAPKVGE